MIDGLKKSSKKEDNEPPKYERISFTTNEEGIGNTRDIPFVPPRRSSIREDSTPIRRPIPLKRPEVRSKSPEVFREMFDLPEETASRLGSLDNLDQQMLKLSQEKVVYLQKISLFFISFKNTLTALAERLFSLINFIV